MGFLNKLFGGESCSVCGLGSNESYETVESWDNDAMTGHCNGDKGQRSITNYTGPLVICGVCGKSYHPACVHGKHCS